MEEKRRYNRFYTSENKKIFLCCEGGREEEVPLLDISANGMRVIFSRPLDKGSIVHARIQIISAVDFYYVKGPIIRIEQKEDFFETSIRFDKISTQPFPESDPS